MSDKPKRPPEPHLVYPCSGCQSGHHAMNCATQNIVDLWLAMRAETKRADEAELVVQMRDGVLFAVLDAVKNVPTYEGRTPTRLDLLQSVRRAAEGYAAFTNAREEAARKIEEWHEDARCLDSAPKCTCLANANLVRKG